MKSEKFEQYIARFLSGDLSSDEETEFRSFYAEAHQDEETEIQSYFELIEKNRSEAFTPIQKEQFFDQLGKKKMPTQPFAYWIAASLTILIIAAGSYWLSASFKSVEKKRQAKVDQTFEVTRLALNSFSMHINTGLKNIESGMDLSKPYHSLSKLQSKTE